MGNLTYHHHNHPPNPPNQQPHHHPHYYHRHNHLHTLLFRHLNQHRMICDHHRCHRMYHHHYDHCHCHRMYCRRRHHHHPLLLRQTVPFHGPFPPVLHVLVLIVLSVILLCYLLRHDDFAFFCVFSPLPFLFSQQYLKIS